MDISFDVFDSTERDLVQKLIDFVNGLEGNNKSLLGDDVDGATDKQISYLKRLGYSGDPSRLSKEDASKEIERLGGK